MARARSSNNTPQSDSLLGAAILSAIVHAAALFGALVVWPMVAPPLELPSDIVPVELLTVADETNIAPQVEEKVEQPPDPAPLPMPAIPEPQMSFDTPPPPEDEPAPDAEATDAKPEPPKPEKPAEPERKFAMSMPKAKPKPEKKKEAFDVDQILKGLDKPQTPPKEAQATASKADRAVKGAGAQSALTMSEIDALKGQLAKCWNVPVGAPDPAALVFRVRVFLNEDGTVASPPQLLDQGRLGDPYFRAAADSAIRAIHICGPYNLPPDKYSSWNEIVITFDPRQMSGY